MPPTLLADIRLRLALRALRGGALTLALGAWCAWVGWAVIEELAR